MYFNFNVDSEHNRKIGIVDFWERLSEFYKNRNTSYNTYLFLVFVERGCVGGGEILDLFPIVTIENWKPLQMDNLEWTKSVYFEK